MSYTLVLEWMPGDLYMSAVTARCTAPTSSYSVVWLPPNKVYQITLYCGSTSLVSFLVGAFRGKAWSYMKTQGGFLITRIKQVGGRVFERILSEKNIDAFNGSQGRILYILWQKDGVPISELSKETGLATTTLTSMLDRMEAANLIYRDRGDKDRRKILIFLTEEAKGLEQEYNEVTEEISNIYYKGFSEEEIEQLENYLHRILKNVEGVL